MGKRSPAVGTGWSPSCKASAKLLRRDGKREDIHSAVVGAEDVSRRWRHKRDAHLMPIREQANGNFEEVGLPSGNERSDMEPIFVVCLNSSRHDCDGVSELPPCQLMSRLPTQSGFGSMRTKHVQRFVSPE
jgi:hypothetical protein